MSGFRNKVGDYVEIKVPPHMDPYDATLACGVITEIEDRTGDSPIVRFKTLVDGHSGERWWFHTRIMRTLPPQEAMELKLKGLTL
jgi:hypothetical protein